MREKLLSFLLINSMALTSSAQCCSPGNPIGGIGNFGAMPSHQWKVSLNYTYSFSGKYFEGDESITPFFVKTGNYNYLGLNMAYAISDRIVTELETGYFISKTQHYLDGIIPSQKIGHGLSSLAFLIKVNVLRDRSRYWEITPGIGLRAPLGSYNTLQYQGAVLPLDIQPSTGAKDIIFTLFLDKEFPEKHQRFFMMHRLELKGINPDQYRYGNLLMSALFISRNLSPHWDALLQLRYEVRHRDERPSQNPPYNQEKISISGSQKVFVSPQLVYSPLPGLQIAFMGDIPAYQYYNSQQLANTFAFTVNLTKTFNTNRN